jgi:hypothetical protein
MGGVPSGPHAVDLHGNSRNLSSGETACFTKVAVLLLACCNREENAQQWKVKQITDVRSHLAVTPMEY